MLKLTRMTSKSTYSPLVHHAACSLLLKQSAEYGVRSQRPRLAQQPAEPYVPCDVRSCPAHPNVLLAHQQRVRSLQQHKSCQDHTRCPLRASVQLDMCISAPRHAHAQLLERSAQHDAHAPSAHVHCIHRLHCVSVQLGMRTNTRATRMRCCPSAPLSTMRTLPARTCTAAARELPNSHALRPSRTGHAHQRPAARACAAARAPCSARCTPASSWSCTPAPCATRLRCCLYCLSASLITMRTHPVCLCNAAACGGKAPTRCAQAQAGQARAPLRHAQALLLERLTPHARCTPRRAHVHRISA